MTLVGESVRQDIKRLFAESEQALAAGDDRLGSQRLWDAAEAALRTLAAGRGWRCETEEQQFYIIEQLQAETGECEDPDIMSGFLDALGYRDNARYGFMEDYFLNGGIAIVHDFVKDILALAGEGG